MLKCLWLLLLWFLIVRSETILIMVVVSVSLSVCLSVQKVSCHAYNFSPVRAILMKSSPTPMFVDPGTKMSSSVSSSDERIHVILVCHAFNMQLLQHTVLLSSHTVLLSSHPMFVSIGIQMSQSFSTSDERIQVTCILIYQRSSSSSLYF